MKWHHILDRVTDALFAVDPEGTFMYMNDAAYRLLYPGGDAIDLIGRCAWTEFPAIVDTKVYEQHYRALREQTPVSFDFYYEPFDAWFESKVFPTPEGATVMLRNVTERKRQAEQAEQRFRSLIQHHPESVCVLGMDGTIRLANAAAEKLTGYALEELTGLPKGCFIHPAEVSSFTAALDRVEQGGTFHMPVRLIRKNGSVVDVEATILPMMEEARVTGSYVFLQDVSERKRILHMLAESERRYKALSENAQDMLTYMSSSGEFQYVSPAVRALLGYNPEELIGRKASDYYHPDDIDRGTSFRRDVELCQGRFVCRFRHKLGQYVWFETTYRSLRDHDHTFLYSVAVWRDISERKQAGERLLKAQRIGKFGSWERGVNDEYYFWSEETYHIYGMKPGSKASTEEALRRIHPEDREKVIVAWDQLKQRTRFDIEYRIVHPDGEIRYVHSRAELEYRRDGVPIVMGLVHDITDRKRVEEQLKRSQDNLNLAKRLAGLGYFDWNLAQDKLYWSEEMIAIWAMEQSSFKLTAESYFKTIHPNDLDSLKADLAAAFAGKPMDSEYRIVRPDGCIRWVHVLGETSYNDLGEPVRFFGTVQDISGQKQTEELLRKSEKLSVAGQLAAGLAHEIRNPLTALKGFNKLMLQTVAQADRERYYGIMQEEFTRIELILGELLILAKPQAMTFRPERLESILKEVVDLLRGQANLNEVILEWDVQGDVPQVTCEKNQLKQVFINVIKNGIEAMEDGGVLFVTLAKVADQIVATFVDQGSGIPQERLVKLGEPFYSTKEKGTGLGLMVSHNIIQAHKGSIRIDSELGKGTTVVITLPMSPKL